MLFPTRTQYLRMFCVLGAVAALALASCQLGGNAEASLPEPHEAAHVDFSLEHDYLSASFDSVVPGKQVSATSTSKPTMNGVYISEGIWSTNLAEAERQLAALGAQGVNTVIDYQLQFPVDPTKVGPGTSWRRYMDAANAAKVKIAFPLTNYLVGLTPSDGTSNAKFTKIKEIITALRSESAIGYFYVHDEKLPSTNIGTTIDLTKNYCISIEQMQALYNLIKATDAVSAGGKGRQQMQVWVSLPNFSQYKARFTDAHRPFGNPAWLANETAYNGMMTKLVQQTTDIVMVDNYPFGNPGVPAGTPLDEYPRIALTRAKTLLKTGQPLVFVYQSFNWKVHNPTGAPNATYPSLANMKLMLKPAKELGCYGAIAYNWYDLDNPAEKRRLPGYEQCFADLKTLITGLKTAWP